MSAVFALSNARQGHAPHNPERGQCKAPELFGQRGDVLGQPCLVRQATGHLALRRVMLTHYAANPALRNAEGLPHMINELAASRRA